MAKVRYDVHIEESADPDSSLVLMRFPAMRSQFENPADLIRLSIKPKNMKVKLGVELDRTSNSFNEERAKALGHKSVSKTFNNPDNLVDMNFYTSTKTPVEDNQLFVAKIVNNKLVCRPISHILTMRSDLSHLDVKEELDIKEEVRPVSVKFAAPERQHAPAKPREEAQEVDEDSEEYIPLNYKTMTSREADSQRKALFGQWMPKIKKDPDCENDNEDEKMDVSFLPDVKPKIEKDDPCDIYSNEMANVGEATSNQGSPKKSASNIVKQRVKDCLLRAKIVSFEEVYNYIRDTSNYPDQVPISQKSILDALNEFALLVQGNWAVKSEILYGDSSEKDCTAVTGISINLFIAARDYLLWLFSQERMVSRIEYSRRVKMPDHDILELFKQLATLRDDNKKWELKLPTDNRFLTKFPEVAQRQLQYWRVRVANKCSIFNG